MGTSRCRRAGAVLLAVGAALAGVGLTGGPVAGLAPGDLTLVSTSAEGVKSDGESIGSRAGLSGDGTRVAFTSTATNLHPDDTDDIRDVYVKDLDTGGLTLVSAAEDGTKADAESSIPIMGPGGDLVAFGSSASNLVPGAANGYGKVFIKDLRTGELVLASAAEDGTPANARSWPSGLSADGTLVAFTSAATNLDPSDTDADADAYVKDLVSGEVTLVSATDEGTSAHGDAVSWGISADGTAVAFSSGATNLGEGAPRSGYSHAYVKDLGSGELLLASSADDGTPAVRGGWPAGLSADGTMVAFDALDDLGEGETNGDRQVYVKDLDSGELTMASTGDDGSTGAGDSHNPWLSADGTRVAYSSNADARSEGDTDSQQDVYVKDLVTGDLVLASTADDGTNSNFGSFGGSLSADGTAVAFDSYATNLDAADTDETPDSYVKELPPRPAPPSCEGRPASVYVVDGRVVGGPDAAEPFAGRLRGTSGPDVIVGTGRADELLAGAGDDRVCARGGADDIFGQRGSDRLLGQLGRDVLTGGRLADHFDGGAGTDAATDFDRAEGDTRTDIP